MSTHKYQWHIGPVDQPIGADILADFGNKGWILCSIESCPNFNAMGPMQIHYFRSSDASIEYRPIPMPDGIPLGFETMNDHGKEGWIYACSGPGGFLSTTKMKNYYFYKIA